jgi:hypothetical protein
MVDPSVAATMDGGPNRVCVGDHAGDAAFWIVKRHPPENKAPPNAMDHAVSPEGPQLQQISAILRIWFSMQQLERARTFASKFERA